MIPMSCPSCGRRGNVPLDRLNTRMHCKKCDAVFHLDPTGKPVMGEPKSAKVGKAGRAGQMADIEQIDPIGIVASKLAKTPKPIWMTGLVLLCGLLVYGGWKLFKPAGQTADQGFAEKNIFVAKAFLARDISGLTYYATTDSREELVKLVETFRPMVGDREGKETEAIEPMAMLPPILDEVPKVEISIQPPAPMEGKAAPPMFFLDLVWQKTNNKYYLNGKATLEVNETRESIRKEIEAKQNPRGKK